MKSRRLEESVPFGGNEKPCLNFLQKLTLHEIEVGRRMQKNIKTAARQFSIKK